MLPYARRFIREYLPGTGSWYLAGISALLVTIACTVTIPQFLKRAVAVLRDAAATGALSEPARDELFTAAVVIAGLGVALAVFRTLSRILIFIPGRRIEERIRQDAFDTVATLPPGRLDDYQAGDLISRGTSDVTGVRVMLSMGVLHSINSVVLLAACLYLMASMHGRLALICLVPAPFLQLLVKRLSRMLMDRSRSVATQLGHLSERVRETFSAHTLMSIYPIVDRMLARFQEGNDNYRHAGERLARVRIGLMTAVGSLSSAAQFLLLLVGGRIVATGESDFGIDDFVAFGAYLALVQEPLRSGGFLLSIFQRGEVCLERLYALIDRARAVAAEQAARPIGDTETLDAAARDDEPLVAVRDLQFSYDGAPGAAPGAFTLSIPELDIRRGCTVGVFGSIGSGKSTLAGILTGNIPAPTGTCRLRGVPFEAIRTQLLLDQFALAPQESRHFALTIRENIDQVARNPALAAAGHPPRAVWETEAALQVSQLAPDLDTFANGTDALLGEHGVNLSGGQRQRLAILRALVKPHHVLVLDDIISSVDHNTESRILSHLFASLRPGAALVFISHRISALMPCDEILVMEKGRIADRGSHAELLERHAVYRATYEHQVLEQRAESDSHGQ